MLCFARILFFALWFAAIGVDIGIADTETPLPEGPEFRVNTRTEYSQHSSISSTNLANGEFVVAWLSADQYSVRKHFYGQRFDSAGLPVGSEFRINSDTAGRLSFWHSVAGLKGGGFIAVWSAGHWEYDPDIQESVLRYRLYGRLYGTSGIPAGGVFQISTETGVNAGGPAVTSTIDGRFVVVWSEFQGPSTVIYGRRYDTSGAPVGSEFPITSESSSEIIPYKSSIAATSDGGFVVAWVLENEDASGNFYGRRFDALGTPAGNEFQINTETNDIQNPISVAAMIDGGFVAVWNAGRWGWNTYGRRYDSSGKPVGGEFQVNLDGHAYGSDVIGTADGGFVVVWNATHKEGGERSDIYGQRFDATASPIGSEFRINTYIDGYQSQPGIAAFGGNRFIVTWASDDQDGSEYGIYGQRFVLPGIMRPSISSISPNPITGSDTAQPLAIHGSNFKAGINVTLRDLRTGEVFENRPISSLSSTSIVINPVFTTAAATWSVEVINPDGLSSGQRQFQVISNAVSLEAPELLSPDDNAIITKSSVKLSWSPVDDAAAYSIRLKDLTTGEIIYNSLKRSVTGRIFRTVREGHSYIWDVASCLDNNGGNNETNCPNRSASIKFKVKTFPRAVVCVSTANSCLKEIDKSDDIAGKIPLILIHGINKDRVPGEPHYDQWDKFLEYFESEEGKEIRKIYKLYKFEYWSNKNNIFLVDLGGALRDALDKMNGNKFNAFGQKKIAIVAHSMGGLVARSFMNRVQYKGSFSGQLGGERVMKLITLGTPHHGSHLANGPARYAFTGIATRIFMDAYDLHHPLDYYEPNRFDLHWDNYDSLFDLKRYPDERNAYLIDLNNNHQYDSKIIAYYGYFDILPKKETIDSGSYWGSLGLRLIFHSKNDLAVPIKSGYFDGHKIYRVRGFPEYDHEQIAKGKFEKPEDDPLFEKLRFDLLAASHGQQSAATKGFEASAMSDLVPQDIGVSSTDLAPGQSFKIDWMLANIGNSAADSESETVVRINQSAISAAGSDDLARIPTPALDAGASVSQTAQLTAPATKGTYFVWLVADDDSEVGNQGANTHNDTQRSVAFTVTAPATALVINGIADSYKTSNVPFQPEIALTGSGLSAIIDIEWSCTSPGGMDCGAMIPWTPANWAGRFAPKNDNVATIVPVLVPPHSPPGTYEWTVTFSTENESVTKQFLVDYTLEGYRTTETDVSAVPEPSAFGEAVTFTAFVETSGGTPTGTVIFKDGAIELGTDVVSGGLARLTTSNLSAGNHSITATYSGDTHFAPSASPELTHAVTAAATSVTTLDSLPNPATLGEEVAFTATIFAGSGQPTGMVTFSDGSKRLGTAAVIDGIARFATSALGAGTHAISALYSGNASFSPSASSGLIQIVEPPQPDTSAVFEGGAKLVSKTSTCKTISELAVGGYANSVYRAKLKADGRPTALSLIFTRSAFSMQQSSGNGQMHGIGEYSGTWISEAASAKNTNGSYDLAISPKTITGKTKSVIIRGEIGSFGGTEKCMIGIEGKYTRQLN